MWVQLSFALTPGPLVEPTGSFRFDGGGKVAGRGARGTVASPNLLLASALLHSAVRKKARFFSGGQKNLFVLAAEEK